MSLSHGKRHNLVHWVQVWPLEQRRRQGPVAHTKERQLNYGVCVRVCSVAYGQYVSTHSRVLRAMVYGLAIERSTVIKHGLAIWLSRMHAAPEPVGDLCKATRAARMVARRTSTIVMGF